MGTSHSKPTADPAHFATPVKQTGQDLTPDRKSWKTYDIIICGGGTAGCVLASRLSENPSTSVLLIEAGNLMTRIPLGFTQTLNTDADWKYETILDYDGKIASCARGKILGGSSSINASLYQRCSPADFSEWVKEGATGWDAEEMKKYFIKSEKYNPNPDFPEIDTEIHGKSGTVATRCGPIAPVVKQIIDACVNVGIPHIPDMNADAGPVGVSHFIGSVGPNGERSSAATSYLTDDVLRRPNLTIAVQTVVSKVVFDSSGADKPHASGVLLMTRKNGPLFAAAARKEVIISAGTVATPQLLSLSGIGPADELKKHGIPVVYDSPFVGKGLLDHFSAGSLVVRAKAGNTWDSILRPLPGLAALLKWLVSGEGPMSSIAAPLGVFVYSDTIILPNENTPGKNDSKLVDLSASHAAPDIEIFFAPLIVVNNGFTKTPGFNGLTIGCVALKPASQGSITLASSNIWDHPIINPGYLSDPHDLQVLLKSVRLAMHIARTPPLADILELPKDSADQSTFFWPGDANPETVSDEDLTAWIKRNGQTAWHPTSSARMGSVVDAQLKVNGVTGLRVVDASIFPTQVSGHPCALVIAVAEKAADMIKMSDQNESSL
ncbi:GMC oxidoreductase [Gymnopus androsaceus JB14]|uniref:GMC oxidoreductase n=1 Tax=Gymnopus androsaceus JB14 TaxID=1447944 RepID=A0A6A4HIH9_9AGAR|nr:GMC oxidoreductase [Gymnopus androsaceus JB14]